MAATATKPKTEMPKARPLSEILEEFYAGNERIAQAQAAHMNMTPEQRRDAEAKVEARTGSRIFNVKDLVAAHEESARPATLLPAGFHAIDLEA